MTYYPLHHHSHRSVVMSRRWAKASACCSQVCRSCATLCMMVSFQKVSISSLFFDDLSCYLFLPNCLPLAIGPNMLSSWTLLTCPVQYHFHSLAFWITPVDFVLSLSLTQILVFLTLRVMIAYFVPWFEIFRPSDETSSIHSHIHWA